MFQRLVSEDHYRNDLVSSSLGYTVYIEALKLAFVRLLFTQTALRVILLSIFSLILYSQGVDSWAAGIVAPVRKILTKEMAL